MKSTIDKLVLAQTLQRELWATGIAYGDPPRLWRVSPNWYHIWPQQWQQVLGFGQLLPILRNVFDGNTELTYLRADFTLNRQGDLILTELNGAPVWDYGTQIVRQIYHCLVELWENDFDPFPGAANQIAKRVKQHFTGRRVVIFLGPQRVSYQAEYGCLAKLFCELGIETITTSDESAIRSGDLIYRTFSKSEAPAELLKKTRRQEVSLWPPFSQLEEKSWMARIYLDKFLLDPVTPFGLDKEKWIQIVRFVPWTWPVESNLNVFVNKKLRYWSDGELMGDRWVNPTKPEISSRHEWVLKRVRGSQGKGTIFSRLLTVPEWRQELLAALISANGQGPTHVLQAEIPTLEHRVRYLGSGLGPNLVEDNGYRVRLCVSYLIEGDRVEVIDADATLRDHPLVHGSSDAVIMPVVVRNKK